MRRYLQHSVLMRSRVAVLFLAILTTTILSTSINMVRANVPSGLQIENLSQGTTGKIRLRVDHLNPGATHFVDVVEVDVSGQVKSFTLQPQSNNPFTIELDLGQIQGTPSLKVRAHCNVHGWSGWSDTVQVPEFSNVAMTVLAALAASLLVARRKAHHITR